MKVKGKHVFITGGSAGIGLCLAKDALKRGASVTLLARNESKLRASRDEIIAAGLGTDKSVFLAPADVTDAQQVLNAVAAATEALGPIDIVICNAGMSIPGYFHRQDLEVHRKHMDVNYFGALHTVQAVYKDMVKRGSGHICFVSSALGCIGLVGFSGYCASKYAMKGLAEALRNELQGTGVEVSLAMPTDTDTPGYKVENEIKPPEAVQLSESGGIYKPEKVAKLILDGIQRGRFYLPCPDPLLSLHYKLTQGIVPRSFLSAVTDALVGWVGPLVQHIFATFNDRIARKHSAQRFADIRG